MLSNRPLAKDPVFKHMSLQGTFDIQATSVATTLSTTECKYLSRIMFTNLKLL